MANFLNKNDGRPKLHHMQMPVPLFHSEKYQSLSLNAKLLWMLYYNRSTASMENDYHDELKNVFCYYTDQQLLDCLRPYISSRTTISNARKELKEWGLITTEKNRHNNGEKVYVRIFEDFYTEGESKKKDVQ